MRQNTTLKNRVIDTLKLRTRFLIKRHTINYKSARSVYARVIAGTYVRKY